MPATLAPVNDAMTDEEQKLHMELEAKERAEQEKREQEVMAQLALPVGGTPASAFMVQITGGEVEMETRLASVFEKDADVQVTVRGWVKTIKNTTEKKGGRAARVAVLVVEEIELP